MYCGLSRGLFELIVVQAMTPVMVAVGRLSSELLLFTSDQTQFFSLPSSFTTGSSIMPHKKNYDLFELARGTAAMFNGYASQLVSLQVNLTSGYQRDLQLSKSIVLQACDDFQSTVRVVEQAISALNVHEMALQNAITDDMKSVEKINELIAAGVPMRDAYRQVKNELGL